MIPVGFILLGSSGTLQPKARLTRKSYHDGGDGGGDSGDGGDDLFFFLITWLGLCSSDKTLTNI